MKKTNEGHKKRRSSSSGARVPLHSRGFAPPRAIGTGMEAQPQRGRTRGLCTGLTEQTRGGHGLTGIVHACPASAAGGSWLGVVFPSCVFFVFLFCLSCPSKGKTRKQHLKTKGKTRKQHQKTRMHLQRVSWTGIGKCAMKLGPAAARRSRRGSWRARARLCVGSPGSVPGPRSRRHRVSS